MSVSSHNKTRHPAYLTTAWVSALAAVYGPFLVAALVTWTLVACDHCRQTWAQMLPTFPGGMVLTLISSLTLHRQLDLPPALMTTLAALLSLALVVITQRLATRGGGAGPAVLIAVTAVSSALAWAAYHLVRA